MHYITGGCSSIILRTADDNIGLSFFMLKESLCELKRVEIYLLKICSLISRRHLHVYLIKLFKRSRTLDIIKENKKF